MIAAPLEIVIAEPTACSTRVPMSSSSDPEIAERNVAIVKTTKPHV